MKDSGYYVKTAQGNIGFTKNRDHYVNGKQVVYLVDENYRPLKDEKGNQKQILADRMKLKILGYIN